MSRTEHQVIDTFERSFEEARCQLAQLDVAQGRAFSGTGLSGWIFEQTIRSCLAEDLSALGVSVSVNEQVSFLGRAKIDLLVGRIAVEIKARGSFGRSDNKYSDYRTAIEARGWDYVYISMQETHSPYRAETKRVFGVDRAFYLDEPGDWQRFVDTVARLQTIADGVRA